MKLLYEEIIAVKFLHTKYNFFLEYLISYFDIMIYMHLSTWVGFGLIGYVPNTLYMYDLCIHNLIVVYP
jgi:hypothetical protein